EISQTSNLLQTRLGDDSEVINTGPEDPVIAEINKQLSKIKASPEEKQMLRKSYVRHQLNATIKDAKEGRSVYSWAAALGPGGALYAKAKQGQTLDFGDKEEMVLKKLRQYGIASIGEYELLERQILQMFVEKGLAATLF